MTVQRVTHHLVSYYNVEDVMAGSLRTPSQTGNLQYIRPRPELTSKQTFRSTIEGAEDVNELTGQGGYGHCMGAGGYEYGKQPQMYYSSQPYPPSTAGPPPIPQYHSSIFSMAPDCLQTSLQTGQMAGAWNTPQQFPPLKCLWHLRQCIR